MDGAVGNAEVTGVRAYDLFNSALEGEERCAAFGFNRIYYQLARLSCHA